MTITSAEALEGIPEGDQIMVRSRRLGNQRWTKDSSGGFSRDAAMVGAEFFIGYIAEGRVVKVDDSPARPGDWFSQNHYDYYHLAVNDAGLLVSLSFFDGVYRSDNEYRVEQFDQAATRMVRGEGIPDRVLANAASMRLLVDRLHDQLMSVTNLLTATREQLAKKPEEKAEPIEPVIERVQVRFGVDGRTWDVEVPTLDPESEDDEPSKV